MRGIRSPAVAGSFYPSDAAELRELVYSLLGREPDVPRRCFGAIVPHAGLMYSGRCAGLVFSQIRIPPLVVVLAPNHTGVVSSPYVASAWPAGAFETPLGSTTVASDFVSAWRARSDLLDSERGPHLDEHAIEVELPFLNMRAPQTSIVPVVMPWDSWELSMELGDSLASVVRDWPEEVLLIASSDMNHFESASVARRKDEMALQCVRELNGQKLLDVCARAHVTMCGRAPAATVLHAAKLLGASLADVVDYRHSGLVTGDHHRVVSYAGVVIE